LKEEAAGVDKTPLLEGIKGWEISGISGKKRLYREIPHLRTLPQAGRVGGYLPEKYQRSSLRIKQLSKPVGHAAQEGCRGGDQLIGGSEAG